MPTYEYECTKCGLRFEKFQKMTDKPLKKCPECRAKVNRLISSGSGIIFKGKGFYQTDYKSSDGGGKLKSKGNKTPPCGKEKSCDSCKE